MVNAVIKVKNLKKSYGDLAAVDDVSFEVNSGEIFGLLGPNGAGKTTVLEILEGLRKPDAGSIDLLGINPFHDNLQLKKIIGVQLQTSGLPAINIITIPPLTTLLHTTLLSIIIISASHLFFNAPLPANWFWFILSLLITAFSLAGLGMLIGVISLNSRATILWSQLIFLPSMLIGGLMVPSSILPKALLKIGFLLPSTYAINMFQGLAQNQTVLFNPAWSIIILLGTGISAFGLAVYLFNWDSRNKTRKGNPFLAILALIPLIIGVIILP